MSKQTDRREVAKAAQDLEHIRALRRIPAFTEYFEPRLIAEAQRIRDKILFNRDLTKDQLWEELLKFRAAFDTAKFMVQDENSCRLLLDSIPQEPDESQDSTATSGE